MQHRLILAASAATFLFAARLACAQPPPGPPSFDAMDKNKDGVLTKDEVVAFFEARRSASGGQGTGAQNGQTRGPGAGGAQGRGPPDPAQVFARWDTNGDGKVTKAEFDARPRPGAGGGGPPPAR
jgi:hypothetical protein